MTTFRAPERLATIAPMMPIGPAPVTRTSSPTRSKESAVWTALPNGSKIAAISSGISSGIGTTLRLRNADKLAERAGTVDADAERVAAQMPPARPAVAALAANDMAFARDALADMVLGDRRADLGDLAAEFMADDHRHGNSLLRPLVPVPDVNVRTADGGFLHPDQHVVRADLRHRHVFHPETHFGLGLDEGFHHVGHQLRSLAWPARSAPHPPAATFPRKRGEEDQRHPRRFPRRVPSPRSYRERVRVRGSPNLN